MALAVGQIVEGEVSNIMKFGAFINLPEDKSGLVHISQISDSYVEKVSDHLEKGQKVQVKVLSMKDGKIDLSIKEALPKTTKPVEVTLTKPEKKDLSFEDKLSKFLKDSNEKYEAARSRQNAKMGTGRRR
ncbi:S1 RNA-binding domain-containing protein [Peptoniphilus equinus]|uniref:S1 RNA-binding domain-containing protein n=1 Tax=Peptoniphilus equinus TaxID=3016343 RepID=A0ABY7QUC6_9FIRM|nr:S1 RNA-binding domain-containing protein [Peptoniphilus equinus]WBW49498.1 S1 RNA-binding domain-containing protein [Peptoniphilus equinus]